MRNLVLVLGDQLDGESAAFDGFDAQHDAILMMEVREEAAYIRQHKRRLAFFFSAMRHFRDEQRASGRQVHYTELDDRDNTGSLAAEVQRRAAQLRPQQVIVVEPGDWRVREQLSALQPLPVIRADRHFLCAESDFRAFADEHPQLLLETFYRWMRKRLDILLGADGAPTGGIWNFDAKNRDRFGRAGDPRIPPLERFQPDATTRNVLAMVDREFANNPGRLQDFDLPVTRDQALDALGNFIEKRLEHFGQYQDAMLGGEPFLFHSHLSGPLNLHLLRPREVVDAVVDNQCAAPLNSVEGFVRQIIGWREFVRGVYWRFMPRYADANALNAELSMPRFYWSGATDMHCLAEAIQHTIDHAYAHHIERLMVLGLFALLASVRPYEVHRWHMSMFWDAVDWVSLPNVLGMSQHADGGVMATKPYVAGGNYINRMSDHCRHCRYDPSVATGENACPFTTLYWDFLVRHKAHFAANRRMTFPYRNLARKGGGELAAIRRRADVLKARVAADASI